MKKELKSTGRKRWHEENMRKKWGTRVKQKGGREEEEELKGEVQIASTYDIMALVLDPSFGAHGYLPFARAPTTTPSFS